MKIDHQTLDKIAHLARLEILDSKREKMLTDMSNMLSFVEKLQEVNTDGVEPLVTMSHEINNLREDAVAHQLSREQALQNAPVSDPDFFRVPKVIE